MSAVHTSKVSRDDSYKEESKIVLAVLIAFVLVAVLDPFDFLQGVVGQLFLGLLPLVLRPSLAVDLEPVDAGDELHLLRLGHQVGVHLF